MKQVIYFATSNAGKFDEVKTYLEKYSSHIELKQYAGEIEEIQSDDQKKIVIHKAKQAWKLLNSPVLVDDSGIFFKAYKNFPGTLTKFVCDALGLEKTCSLLDGMDKGAYFQLNLAYIDGEDSIHLFEGRCDGTIVPAVNSAAKKGLPWDTVFMPDGYTKTYSELYETTDFESCGYRLRALRTFLEWFNATKAMQNSKKDPSVHR